MQDKTYDISIERTVLSSLIFDFEQHKLKINTIKGEMFFLPIHKTIFELIVDMDKKSKIFDENILRSILGSQSEEELLNIISSTPLSNLESYIEVLADLSLKRQITKLVHDLGSEAGHSSGSELQNKLSNLSNELKTYQSTPLLEIENIKEIEANETEFICKSWLPIPKRTVSLITAPGGTGKSWLVLQLVLRAIKEKDVKKAFLWLSEDPKEITKHRFDKVFNEVLKYSDETIKEKIDISSSPTIQFIYEDQRRVEISPSLSHFKAMLDEYDLIILDPLIAFFGVDENNNAHARRFMQLFTEWASKENKTIIFIHHSTKNTTQSRGASAFVDAVRLVYELDKIKDEEGRVVETNKRHIKLTKDNYGASQLTNAFSFERTLFPAEVKYETVKQRAKEAVINSVNLHPDF